MIINARLQNLIDRLSAHFANNEFSMTDLEFDDYRYVSEFENLMALLDRLLIDFKQLPEKEMQSLLTLITHGFIQYQTDNSFDSQEDKTFNLRLSIEAKIERALLEMTAKDIPIIRNLVGSMFSASMNVSEELLEKINQADFADDKNSRFNTAPSFNDMIKHFDELAISMELTSDYQMYQQVAEQLNQLPADAAPMMMSALLQATNQLNRDSAILLLMHPLEKIRNSLYPLLTSFADKGLLNSTDQVRLMSLRNWVNDEQKNIIDQTIKKLQRLKARQIARIDNQPSLNDRTLLEIIITPSDLGGAMSFHAMFQTKGQYEVLGVILKLPFGVKDGFILNGLNQEQFEEVLEQANEGMPMRRIGINQVDILISHFLTINLIERNIIPVEILLLSEYLNINWLCPQSLNLETTKAIVEQIKFDPYEAMDVQEFVCGWASNSYLKNHKTVKTILNKEFEPDRETWLERVMLTCLGFCQSLQQIDLFLDAAVKLNSGKKMHQINLFKQIADTVLNGEQMMSLPPGFDAEMLEEMLASGINMEQLNDILAQTQLTMDGKGLQEPDWLEQDFNEDNWQDNPFMLPASDAGESKKWTPGKRVKRAVYQIKISLKGSKPAIWRRVTVMNSMTLDQLHSVIIMAMGWSGGHLYEFNHGRDRFGPPDELGEWDIYDDSQVQLRDLIYKVKAKLDYVYDFGDHWAHKIQLEKILPAKRENTPPQVTKGVNACPPDDCGGIHGYYEYLSILKQPNHEEYESLKEWMGLEKGEIFDPSYYDIENANLQIGSE